MAYAIIILPSAQKQLDKLPVRVQGKLDTAINLLADNPRPNGAIKLTGLDAYRIRAGNYRIIYEVADKQLLVTVLRAAHRKEAYNK